VVQIGVFAKPETAKGLQEKLSKQGLHVYVEKIGPNMRVRVGSFPTHEAADKVRRKLESQGMHSNIVNLGG
jgi:cell division protein FtsN